MRARSQRLTVTTRTWATPGRRRRAKREGLRRALPATRFRDLDPRQASGDGGVLRRRQDRSGAMGERGLDGLFPERGQAAPDRAVPPSLAPCGRGLRLPGLAMRRELWRGWRLGRDAVAASA